MRRLARRRSAVCAAVCVLASLVATPAHADEQFTFERLAGADRYATAAEIGRAVAGAGDRVLLATGEAYPDALAAAHLAGARSAPILLVTRTAVPAVTAQALRDLGATSVTILGGTGAIDDAVVVELRAAGYAVERVAGIDRYETARLVAEAAGANAVGTVDGSRTAIVAGGNSFAEAMAAGPLAYDSGLPILLTAADGLSAPAASALRTLQIERVLVLGGTTQVGVAVEDDISALGMAVQRLGSSDRSATAAAVADFAVASLGFPASRANLARADDFADALAAGPLGGSTRAVTLLTASPTELGSATASWLRANASTLTGGVIYGGTGAVSSSVEAAATSAAGGVSSGAGGTGSASSVAITGGPADGAITTDTTPTYTGTATASGGTVRRVTVAIDGGLPGTTGLRCTGCGTGSATWELTPAALTDGRHTFTFRAENSAGSSSPLVSTSMTVDTIAPTFLSIAGARGATLVPAELSEPIRCSTVSPADFTARLNGVATTVGEARCLGVGASTIDLVIGRAPEAQDVLEVRLDGLVTDLAGNVAATQSHSIIVGNVGAPIATIAEPAADGVHTNVRRPLFAGHATSDRSVTAVEVRLGTRPFTTTDVVCDGCGGSDVDWSYRVFNDNVMSGDLPDGLYQVDVRARDDAGVLADVVSRTITIDGTAPVWPANSSTTPKPLTATAGSFTITATFVDANGIACASVAVSDFTAKVGGQATAVTAFSCVGEASNAIQLTLAKAPATLQAVELTISAGALADRAGNTAPAAASTRSVTV